MRVVVALLLAIAIAALAAAPAGAQKPTETQPPAAAAPPRLDAKAWILIDPRDDSVLASKSPDKRLPIASTTKLMTAYLALKHLKPSQMIAAQDYHPEASAEIELGLRAGERMRVRDLLYGLLLPSASDAAETLAVGVAGSVPAFVTRMNQAAQRLGLTRYQLRQPDRARRPRQLLERARPGHPRLDPAAQPALRPDRQHAERHPPQRRSPADGDQPRHAAQLRPLDQRGEDRPHARRRLRPGRLGHPGLDHPDLGGARHSRRGQPATPTR